MDELNDIAMIRDPVERYRQARGWMTRNTLRTTDALWFRANRIRVAALASMSPAEIRREGDEAQGRKIKVNVYSLDLEELGL